MGTVGTGGLEFEEDDGVSVGEGGDVSSFCLLDEGLYGLLSREAADSAVVGGCTAACECAALVAPLPIM